MNRCARELAAHLSAVLLLACTGGLAAGCSPSGSSSQPAPSAATSPAADRSSPFYKLGEKLAQTAISSDGYSTSGLSARAFCADLEFPIQDDMPPDLRAILNQVPSGNTDDNSQFTYGCEAAATAAAHAGK